MMPEPHCVPLVSIRIPAQAHGKCFGTKQEQVSSSIVPANPAAGAAPTFGRGEPRTGTAPPSGFSRRRASTIRGYAAAISPRFIPRLPLVRRSAARPQPPFYPFTLLALKFFDSAAATDGWQHNFSPFSLQPSIATRDVQVRLWKELILEYCRSQRIYIVSLEQEFPLFSNSAIERSLSREAKEVFLSSLVTEGEWEYLSSVPGENIPAGRVDGQELQQVIENGLGSTMPVEDIRSGFDTRGTELAGIDSIIVMRALRLLEQKGKAAIFKVNDCEGVKFCI
ncbi:vacuolar protein sorting-associated protein 25-like [Panicum miliaceum]|uniref:Vacuolar protein sorting-associated protein 25-like n=1 Tax=Panicum miliaceum TaxID=4540 RepID=A0A3L6STC9_PANMI|nr:vacuolar protein sorting-associated protein 25-like [Panicum miliaceum]